MCLPPYPSYPKKQNTGEREKSKKQKAAPGEQGDLPRAQAELLSGTARVFMLKFIK
jgi:hypothetical protein